MNVYKKLYLFRNPEFSYKTSTIIEILDEQEFKK